MHAFGERSRLARRWAKVTQKQLAEGIKAHRVTISRVESGKDYPGLSLACRWARFLGVHIYWLAGLIDDHRPGIQLDTEQERQNYAAYKAMAPDERALFAEMMTDFMKARRIAKSGATQRSRV